MEHVVFSFGLCVAFALLLSFFFVCVFFIPLAPSYKSQDKLSHDSTPRLIPSLSLQQNKTKRQTTNQSRHHQTTPTPSRLRCPPRPHGVAAGPSPRPCGRHGGKGARGGGVQQLAPAAVQGAGQGGAHGGQGAVDGRGEEEGGGGCGWLGVCGDGECEGEELLELREGVEDLFLWCLCLI